MRLHGVVPKVAAEVNGWGVITSFVAAGVGVSVVPDVCIAEHDRVWKIRIQGVVPQRKYGAITRRRGPLSLAASRLLEIMTAGLPDASGEQ